MTILIRQLSHCTHTYTHTPIIPGCPSMLSYRASSDITGYSSFHSEVLHSFPCSCNSSRKVIKASRLFLCCLFSQSFSFLLLSASSCNISDNSTTKENIYLLFQAFLCASQKQLKLLLCPLLNKPQHKHINNFLNQLSFFIPCSSSSSL